MDDYDSPWKEAIEDWFEPFLAIFFPAVHAQIEVHSTQYEVRSTQFTRFNLLRYLGTEYSVLSTQYSVPGDFGPSEDHANAKQR